MSKKEAVQGTWLVRAQPLRRSRKRSMKTSFRRVCSPLNLHPSQRKMRIILTQQVKDENTETKNHSAARKLVNLKLMVLQFGWIRTTLNSPRLSESHRYLTRRPQRDWMLQQLILITDPITSIRQMTSNPSKTKRSGTLRFKFKG
jgi:hypothetical protein